MVHWFPGSDGNRYVRLLLYPKRACISYAIYKSLVLVHMLINILLVLALPAVLAHSGSIQVPAMIMSILGGLLIYGTIISFSMFFQETEEF